MLIAVDGVKSRISLRQCDALVPPLAAVLQGWRFHIVQADGADEDAAISVRRRARRYLITSPWLDAPVAERTEVGAVFSLAAELACAFAQENAQLCFHGAAVEIDGHLLLFPDAENSGKSTLAARLAAQGLRLFADDVLPLSASLRGLSLGIAPRLRLPLPAASRLRAFAARHRGPGDDEFLYLRLPAARLAPHGQSAPLGAIVLLDRRRSAAAKLMPLARGHAMRQLIIQNFAPGGTSVATLDRLRRLIARTACFVLTYSDLDAAADLLCDRFAAPNAPWREEPTGRPRTTRITLSPACASTRPGVAHFLQQPGVALRRVDDDVFLARPARPLFHLNAVAASLWRMLERPTAIATAVEAIRQAFPQADARRVKRDVRDAFDALRQGGLIRAAPVTRRSPA